MHGTPRCHVIGKTNGTSFHVYHRIDCGMAIKYDHFNHQNYKPASELHHVANNNSNSILCFYILKDTT